MKEIILKRYENRRIYNLQQKKYVNLNDINEMIKKGEKVVIIDNKTGEDITNQILLQIIYNIALENLSIFSSAFLHKVIELENFFYNEIFLNYIKNFYSMFSLFENKFNKFQEGENE